MTSRTPARWWGCSRRTSATGSPDPSRRPQRPELRHARATGIAVLGELDLFARALAGHLVDAQRVQRESQRRAVVRVARVGEREFTRRRYHGRHVVPGDAECVARKVRAANGSRKRTSSRKVIRPAT